MNNKQKNLFRVFAFFFARPMTQTMVKAIISKNDIEQLITSSVLNTHWLE